MQTQQSYPTLSEQFNALLLEAEKAKAWLEAWQRAPIRYRKNDVFLAFVDNALNTLTQATEGTNRVETN